MGAYGVIAAQAQLGEAELSFARAKRRDLLASVLYRAGRTAFRVAGPRALAVELRLNRIMNRLAWEHAGALYGDEFHNAVMALPAAPLSEWVPPGSRVLDIGCGVGRLARLLAPQAAEVLGIDRNPRAIAIARQRTPVTSSARFEVAEVGAPLPEGFDVAVLSHVIEHIEDVDALLRQLHALTSRLLVEVPQFGMDSLNVIRRHRGMDFSSDADHVREYTPELLAAQLQRNGWRITDRFERPIALAVLAERG